MFNNPPMLMTNDMLAITQQPQHILINPIADLQQNPNTQQQVMEGGSQLVL